MNAADVIIVGGGIMGTSAALFLRPSWEIGPSCSNET